MKKIPGPLYNVEFFKERRRRLAQAMPKNSALILFSAPELIRNNDVHHYYRQDSDLFYLTGYEEADTVFVFTPGQEIESTLFVLEKDPLKETWDGFMYGTQGAKEAFQMDQVFDIKDFMEKAPGLLNYADQIFYRTFFNADNDSKVSQILNKVKRNKGRSGLGLMTVADPLSLLGELRVKKSEEEIQMLRKSCQISSEAHVELMKASRPGISERELYGLFLYETMRRGAQREGYAAIVASGYHATALHYKSNDDICNDGELLLVDAGAEYNYLSADITRTFPVNGTFTAVQKAVYNEVLDIQKQMVAAVRPGVSFKELNEKCIELTTESLIRLGLFKQSKEEIIEKRLFVKYYPHGLGHYLGMDVHDVGAYYNSSMTESIKFQPGYVLTIEPGIYIPKDDKTAPPEMRGIGIRIEDDVLVTPEGFEVLTHDCPKEISEIESLMAR